MLSTATYRADHVGSFLRPKELLDLRHADADPERLREVEDREILRVLAKQKELGFELFTDGEFRRGGFMTDLTDAVEGFDSHEGVARTWNANDAAKGTAPSAVRGIVTEKLRQTRRLTALELPFLKEHSPGPIKMTLPSATQFPAISYKKGISDRAYPNHSAFLADVVDIVKGETKALAEDGVAYIQIDAPRYSYYLDPKWRDFLKSEFGEPDALLDEAIAADNACFRAARKPGVTLAIHLCRGNNRSQWYASGGYDAIAEKLFNELEVDRFLLEYDDERSGTFEPLRFVPKGKTVVLGLVSSKKPELEDESELIRRIEAASKYVPLENLALSPQCGFASMAEGNLLTEADQWAKLKLVVDVARKVW
ncbi:MAG TPA: cobalamin-independent methionine synthase II family protein [Candidatus Elarobacter sp.]|jgi:5-methyltetrahydropteroyltriglutamate--homocysteine methyltransferase|nr:cobalamin-independent methionine synthase II family protein [Candidatus Elarobacter sp.]